ncbi:MAG: thiamine pyrophosphokinase [Candidatus Poriferisodalaceae bacterium]|jgi:thiamine pyrophosphokinase
MFDMEPGKRPNEPPTTALVVDGGPVAPQAWPAHLAAEQAGGRLVVIAADSGAQHALAHDLSVDVVVGDMDSIDVDSLAIIEASGAIVDRYPADKDRSDLELALDYAVDLQVATILVVSSGAGRLDHAVIGLMLLGRPDLHDLDVTAYVDTMIVVPIGPGRTRMLPCVTNGIVSLIPWGGSAIVSTTDLKWNLNHGTLSPDTALGLSNVATGPDVFVTSHVGTVLACVQAEN